MVRSFLVALFALSALSAGATECGVKQTVLMKPFAGHWQDDEGDYYDIAVGKIAHRYAVHLVTGDEIKVDRYHFAVARGEDDMGSVLDCRKLTATERDKIGKDLADLAAIVAQPGDNADLALFGKSLANPPYPMMVADHYEDRQWLILLDQTHLLDIWYGEGQFSVWVYTKR